MRERALDSRWFPYHYRVNPGLAEFAYNNSTHSATKQSQFFANYGFHRSYLFKAIPECSVPAVLETMNFFDANNKLLQETMAKTQEYNKKVLDKKKTRRINSGTW